MTSETVTDMKGNIVKMEVDYSETCDKKIPELEEMAKVSHNNLLTFLFKFRKITF